MTVDHLSAKTRRRLARSPYAPIQGDDEMALLRTDVLARLLLERVLRVGPMAEPAAILMLESRAPGRAHEVISHAHARGMIRRVPGLDDEPTMLVAPTHTANQPIAA